MPIAFPAAVPEIPVRDIDVAAEYYVQALGFTLDWGDNAGGIAGISRGACRMFLTNTQFRQHYGIAGPPASIWLNLGSKLEVDKLHTHWRESGAILLGAPEDKPWHLREFRAADPDGNQLRVFYDFSSGHKKQQ